MNSALRKLYFAELEKEIAELVDPETGKLAEANSALIDCPLCGAAADRHEELFVKKGYTFVRCRECSLIFTNPQVKSHLLGELYGHSQANDLWVRIQESEQEQVWKFEYFRELIALVDAARPGRSLRLLDIGCSTGLFLDIVRTDRPEWRATGLELNQRAYEIAASKGLDVRRKFLNDLDASETFDVVTLFGVLEHVPHPARLLEEIKGRANPGALLVVVVPNVYSLSNMMLQSSSLSMDGRNHLIYFSMSTLRALLEKQGFEVTHLDTVLSGLDNVIRQAQFYHVDPDDPLRFLPSRIRAALEDGSLETAIYKHDLGYRIRALASLDSREA